MQDGSRFSGRMVIAFIIATILATGVHGAEVFDVDLPEQPLAEALRALGKRTETNILIDRRLVKNQIAPALKANLTADQAIATLLSGTGLKHRFLNEHTVVLEAASNTTLDTSALGAGPIRLARNAGANKTQEQSDAASGSPNSERSISTSEQVDEVVVTGSHIRGLINKTAQTLVLDRKYIDSTGLGTTTRLLESLPQNFALANQSATVNNPPGANNDILQGSSINLRGIGEGTTLILLNGRRMPLGFQGSQADISSLPLSAIERVEVLTDGASAIYGSDAVGGVVNFVLRSNYDSAETHLMGGGADGTGEYRVSQVLGNRWDSGSLLISGEYYSRDLLRAEDRDFVPDNVMVRSLLPQEEISSAVLSLKQDIGATLVFFADALFSHRNTNNKSERTGQGGPFLFNGSARGQVDQLSSAAGVDWRFGGGWNLRTHVGFGSYELDSVLASRVDIPAAVSTSKYETRQLEMKADGALFAWSGGTVRAAIGGSVRDESFKGLLVTTQTGIDAEQDVKSLYAEVNVPFVTADNARPGLHALELSLAGRYDTYSNFGSSVDPRIGLAWEPTAGLRLRGSWGTSYTAPKLADYDPSFNASVAFSFPDPGVPAGVSYQLSLNGTDASGLSAQESDNYSIGLDFTPQSLQGVQLGVNYFDVKYRGKITTPPTDILLILANAETYGPLFVRDPTQEQVNAAVQFGGTGQGFYAFNPDFTPNTNFTWDQVDVILDLRRRNLSAISISGLDAYLRYDRNLSTAGNISLTFNGTYLIDREEQLTSTSSPFETIDTIFNPASVRLRGGVSWQRQQWSVNSFINYTGDYTDNRLAPFQQVDAFTTLDANIGYRFANTKGFLSGASVALAMTNILDEDPPSTRVISLLGSTFDMGFDPTNASPLGRWVSVAFTKTWH